MRPRIEYPELFIDCLRIAIDTPALLIEFKRLTGHDLTDSRPVIVRAIDSATGYFEAGGREFYEFVYDAVYLRAIPALGGTPGYPKVSCESDKS
jgi:hypothetical protein